jgi:hypothetical protein
LWDIGVGNQESSIQPTMIGGIDALWILTIGPIRKYSLAMPRRAL